MPSDLQNFFWLIKLRDPVKDETCITRINQLNEQVPFKVKNKEKCTPKESHHTVSTYVDLAESDINGLMKQPAKKLKYNLTYKEHTAMQELSKSKDFIITNADKGGTVVIMDTYSYIKEANKQLSDRASYKQLTQDLTLQHNRMINQTIERLKNEIILPKKNCRWSKSRSPKDNKLHFTKHP